jgi:isopentenyldiphosphate isomerase
MEELIAEVDENDNVIGMRPISDFNSTKHIHRSVHLALFNSNGQMLLQKRSPGKRWNPNRYTWSVSGTVENESYEDSLKREMREEIGVSAPIQFVFKYLFSTADEKAFHAVFIAHSDDKITPDFHEMTEVKWMPLKDIVVDVKLHPEKYTPPFMYGIIRYWRLLEAKK